MIAKIDAFIEEMLYWASQNSSEYAWIDGVFVSRTHFAAAEALVDLHFVIELKSTIPSMRRFIFNEFC